MIAVAQMRCVMHACVQTLCLTTLAVAQAQDGMHACTLSSRTVKLAFAQTQPQTPALACLLCQSYVTRVCIQSSCMASHAVAQAHYVMQVSHSKHSMCDILIMHQVMVYGGLTQSDTVAGHLLVLTTFRF